MPLAREVCVCEGDRRRGVVRRGVNTLCTELGVPLAREVCRRVGSGGGPSVLASLAGRGNGRREKCECMYHYDSPLVLCRQGEE